MSVVVDPTPSGCYVPHVRQKSCYTPFEGANSTSSWLFAHGLLTLQGQARPLEEKLVANTSLVRWMYVLRLAVETGQCDPQKWRDLQQLLLVESGKPIDVEGLYSSRDGIRAVLLGPDGEPRRGGVFSRPTESRGELTHLIECGHARLAKLNLLLRALWNNPAGMRSVSSEERKVALNDLVGVAVGERALHPKLVLQLLSALGHDIIRRARAAHEAVPQALPREIASMRMSPKGVMGEADKRAAVTVTKLAALVRVTETLNKRGGNLSAELAQRGSALQGELRIQIKHHQEQVVEPKQQVVDALGAAEDFIAELPPDANEHGPGNSQLDMMIHLLGTVTNG